jgi:hypothetical protein
MSHGFPTENAGGNDDGQDGHHDGLASECAPTSQDAMPTSDTSVENTSIIGSE